jgi:hypothetical protein
MNLLEWQESFSTRSDNANIHTAEIYADVVMEKKADAVNLMNGLFG